MPPTKEELLVEIESVIRTMPPPPTFDARPSLDTLIWLGRAGAAIGNWDPSKTAAAGEYIQSCSMDSAFYARGGLRDLTILLHQARHDLLLQIPGAGSAAVAQGMVFDYFDDIRKKIELAKQDVLFVDPYLDAEFVARFLPSVAPGVTIRLLTSKKLAALLPAVDTFSLQNSRKIEVRSSSNLHDRFLLVDGSSCYQSGASFKDGAKSAPTAVIEIVDTFPAVLKIYEDMWKAAKVER